MMYLLMLSATALAQTSQVLAPGKVFEKCMDLATKQTLHYEFTAREGLLFNLHYHVGKEVYYPIAEGLKKAEQGSFRAISTQHYCLMWTNKQKQPVELKLTFRVSLAPSL